MSIKSLRTQILATAVLALSVQTKADVFYSVSKEDNTALSKAAHACAMDYIKAVELESGVGALRQADLRSELSPDLSEAYRKKFEGIVATSSNATPALKEIFGEDKLLVIKRSIDVQGQPRQPTLRELQNPTDVASFSYLVHGADGLRDRRKLRGNNPTLSKYPDSASTDKIAAFYGRADSGAESEFYHLFSQCGKVPKASSLLRSGALRSCRNLNTLSKNVKVRSSYSEDPSHDRVSAEELVNPRLEKCLSNADRLLATEQRPSSSQEH